MTPVQFITHRTARYGYVEGALMALEGGCRWIQLRMKEAPDDDVRAAAAALLPRCRACGAVLILDDRVTLARETGADGVHLGKTDMPVAEARRLLGSGFIIGGTANTLDDIVSHARQGADYIGCGPFRFTETKKNLAPVLGLDGYRQIMAGLRELGLRLPVVAIGGIRADDLPDLAATGVDGVAVSGSVLGSDDPVAAMARLVSLNTCFQKK
ncbi:MAG: thiamine phosphate synthase [Bacteroidales bacterium]|nr:thiamine phosphate synthase [Bacteroidales bacterium]